AGFFNVSSAGFTIAGSGSTTYAISTPGTAEKPGSSCLPRVRRPITASRTFSFGLSAARLYEIADSVNADAAGNSRRVADIGSAPGMMEKDFTRLLWYPGGSGTSQETFR